MKKILFAMMVLVAAQTASAAGFYRCTNVDGTAEWAIEINLVSKQAAFFDNDSWSVVPLKAMSELESMPPQTVYTFQGLDTNRTPMKILFNKTRMSGTVITRPGTPKQENLEAKDGCQTVNASGLLSGI